jgi:hypothetical protein
MRTGEDWFLGLMKRRPLSPRKPPAESVLIEEDIDILSKVTDLRH